MQSTHFHRGAVGPATPTIPLLPCPFCGSRAQWFRTGREGGVECAELEDCPGRAQTDVYAPEHFDSAAAVWNRREDGNADALGRLLEAVHALRHYVTFDDEGDLDRAAFDAMLEQADLQISYACFHAGTDQPRQDDGRRTRRVPADDTEGGAL